MRKVAFLASILLLVLCNVTGVQALPPAFLNSTVLIKWQTIQGEHAIAHHGTGFLIAKEFSEGKLHVFLVTNKHVLPREIECNCPDINYEKSVSIRVNIQKEGKLEVKFVDVPVLGRSGKYLPSVRLHTTADVAVVNITKSIIQHGIKQAWIPDLLLATKDIFEKQEIGIGDEVFLLGYPQSMYDPRNVSPVLRAGVIASSPITGYVFNDEIKRRWGLPDKIDGFLIDASVFPGSSGSLVILKPQGFVMDDKGNLVMGPKRNPYLLGIISGSIPIEDEALGSRQRMGLGVVYGADVIRETIEQFYVNTGSPTPSPTPAPAPAQTPLSHSPGAAPRRTSPCRQRAPASP